MTIIIDGYNFIKHVVGSSYVSEREIDSWIKRFDEYVSLRHNDVVIFFDAGPGYYKSVEQYGKIVIYYSGQEQTADDLIKDWLAKHKGQDVLLVTSDRDICDFASRLQFVSIGSQDFSRVFNHVMAQEAEYEQKLSATVHKVSRDAHPDLDELMEQGSRDLVNADVQYHDHIPIRIRNGKKASRQDKRLTRKIEKV